ncbi:beta-N-acetylglucosaminidase domain-containing protein [Clostridium tarantellae]|uniref:Hyaluronidase n=1 Tax=Clostridium tarantellae TaxID=39493 RepID=A0A6I1MLV5_9CLOT|nr:beta-N-acetylglucosaminidase domain-containing protein [Clostridium tarantellae]MPQ43212.1 hypothetical protein [Clostridium tarantellae]
MLKRSKKFLASIISTMFVFSLIPINAKVLATSNENVKVTVPYLNPVVQNLQEIGDGFKLTDTVNIVGEESANETAVNFLKELLQGNGINISSEFNSENTTIVLGETSGNEADENIKEIVEALNLTNDEALTKKEGYVLYTSNDDENGENGAIVIAGTDNDGTYYGVATLKQLLQKENSVKVPEVKISDFAEIGFRGIVEGFYGDQWSHDNRKSLIDLGGEYKMNTYIYGPKDDPYHKNKWRDPYPEAEANKIKDLVETSNKNNVDFVWAIHPGGSITFTEEDYQALLNKCNLMYDLGVRAFAVFFDDISGPGTDANKQAEFLNRLNEDLVKSKGDVAPLIMCPTEYNKWWANHNPGTYLDILGEKLSKDVQIMWTGDKVMSDINKACLEWVNNRVKRDVYVWWNFPVNDYCRDRLLLGEAYGLANDVDNASGFVSNPMNHAQASKFGLYSVFNYSWNVDAYNSTESWINAIEALVPEVKEDFKVFAIHNADAYTDYHQYRRNESEHLKPVIGKFREALTNEGNLKDSADRLIEEFKAIKKAGRNILDNCKNEGLISEIELWLQSFEQLGIAGENIINSIIALKSDDYNGWWESYSKAKIALDEMKRIDSENRQDQPQPGVKVASNAVTPFVKEMFKESEKMYTDLVYFEDVTKYELSPITSFSSQNNINNMVDGDESTYYYAQELLEVGDYYGVDLGKIVPITEVKIVQGRNDNDHDRFHKGILEYSIDGETWIAIGGERTGIKIEENNLDIQARYVRYRATYAGIPGGKPDLWTAVREFSISNGGGTSINTNIEELKALKVIKDDEAGTIYYPTIEDLTVDSGEYLGFQLSKLSKLENFRLNMNLTEGSLENLKLQYSINGLEWNDLDTTINNGVLEISKNVVAKYVRAINVGDESLKGSLEEFLIGFPTKVIATANTNAPIHSGTASNLVDNNMETSLWTTEQKVGDYYEVDLGKAIELHDITIYSDKNDFVKSGVLEVSLDGETWKVINDFSSIPQNKEVDERSKYHTIKGNGNGAEYRYIRLRMTGESDIWSKIHEITFNETVKDDVVSAIDGTFEGDLSKLADGKLDTAFISSREAIAGDYINYKITSIEPIKNIHILQDSNAISNGKVSVRTENNKWVEVGVLDKAFNNISLQNLVNEGHSNKILDIKISWDNNGIAPSINEIITLKGELIPDIIPDPTIKPNKPRNLSLDNATSDSITISWKEPENIEIKEYIVYLDGVKIDTISGDEKIYTVSNLKSNTLYGLKVVAKGKNDLLSRPVAINGRTKKK